jgi:hypothetical protein
MQHTKQTSCVEVIKQLLLLQQRNMHGTQCGTEQWQVNNDTCCYDHPSVCYQYCNYIMLCQQSLLDIQGTLGSTETHAAGCCCCTSSSPTLVAELLETIALSLPPASS